MGEREALMTQENVESTSNFSFAESLSVSDLPINGHTICLTSSQFQPYLSITFKILLHYSLQSATLCFDFCPFLGEILYILTRL